MGRKRRESDVYGVHRFPRATLNPNDVRKPLFPVCFDYYQSYVLLLYTGWRVDRSKSVIFQGNGKAS